MLPEIGCTYATDLNCIHPQGVPSDSLGSFKVLAAVEGGGKPVLHTFFEHAALAIYLFVLYILYIHNIFHCLKYGWDEGGMQKYESEN
jgi:hypothetical protein